MKGYRQLISEIKSRKVVFAFGRFQPPTIGHELLVKAVQRIAQEQGADHVIFASRSQDKKSNPLNVKDKVYFLKRMFPTANFMAAGDNTRTFIEVAKELNKKYKSIVMVGGSDRVAEFQRILNTYNGREFNFDSIEVKSAGERDPDSDSAAGMSGTKMRMAAKDGDFNKFKSGLPSTLTAVDSRRLFNAIRSGMGLDAIKEEVEFERDTIRENYHAGKILHLGDIVRDKKGLTFEIVDRGSNYVTVVNESGDLFRKWIYDVVSEGKKKQAKKKLVDDSIYFKGFKTVHLHKSEDVQFFKKLVESNNDPVAVLNAIKLADELIEEYDAEKYNKFEQYLKNIDMLEEYQTSIEERLQEMKFNSADKIKVARIIGMSLGIEKIDTMSNPTQIINMGLRKLRNKRITPEMKNILMKMLDTAKMAGIEYDEKLIPALQSKEDIKEAAEPQTFMTYYQFRQQLGAGGHRHVGQSLDKDPRMAHRKAHQMMEEAEELEEAEEDAAKAAEVADLRARQAKEKHQLVRKHEAEREKIMSEEEEKDDDMEEIDDDEFDDEIESITDPEHILHLYDDEELAVVDDEGNEVEDDDDEEEDKEQVDEAISRIERMKRRMRFARTKSKRERRKSIALKRRSTQPVINRRARKHAILMLKKRLARKPLDKLSVQEKERLERIVQQRKKLIDRLAVRLAPKIRKIESDRLRHQKFTKEEVDQELEEGLQQTLRKYVPGYAKKQIDKKMDAEKFGRRDVDKDVNYWRYKKVQDKLKKEEVEIDEAMSNDDKSSIALKALVAKKNLKQAGNKVKSVDFLKKMKDRVKAGDDLKKEELEEFISDEEFEQILQMEDVTVEYATEEEAAQFDTLLEAEYQGRDVPLGKPMAGDVKKSKVYVKDPDTGNVIKVNFGDKNMTIKKSNPERRKSFRARHKCDTANDRTTPRYWSCKAW